MGIKGKIKLEIRDAKTGELKYSREENNMVTDAVYNVLNGAVARLNKTSSGSNLTFGSSGMEIIKTLFGGILIFDESIDTSHRVPSYTEMRTMIGNGNMYGDIANNTHKGSLRSATITEDTAEFTWDFSTGEGNGVIASICLTSSKGGELGCNIESRDSVRYSDSFINVSGNELVAGGAHPLDTSLILNIPFTLGAPTAKTLCILDDSYFTTYCSDGVNVKKTYDLRDYQNSFLFNYNGGIKAIIPEEDEFDIGLELDGYVLINGPICDYGLQAKCDYAMQGDNPIYTLHLVKCTSFGQEEIDVPMNNIITAILEDYQNRGLSGGTSPQTPEQIVQSINVSLNKTLFTYGNKLYWLVGHMNYTEAENDFLSVYVQEYNGSYVVVTPQNDAIFYDLIGRNISNKVRLWGTLFEYWNAINTCFSLAFIIDKVYLTSNDYYFLINLDPSDVIGRALINRADYYIPNGNNTIGGIITDTLSMTPYYRTIGKAICNVGDSFNWNLSFVLRTCYLATIQNQSNPATKTPADTMSITYTLTRSYE